MGAAAAKKAAAEEEAVKKAAAVTLARLQRTPGTREWNTTLTRQQRTPGTREWNAVVDQLNRVEAEYQGYEHLAFFNNARCIQAEHARALKQILYIRTLGIAHLRGFASRARIFQMMQSLTIKRTIWRYLDFAEPMALEVEIVTPPTSESSKYYTATTMLAGEKVWCTKKMPAHQVESVVLGVAAGSHVTSFDVASYGSMDDQQMCVEEVAADGTIGATLVAWKHYGTHNRSYTTQHSRSYNTPSNYTPATIAVETTATRFKVSVHHTYDALQGYYTGVAIFRATGAAP